MEAEGLMPPGLMVGKARQWMIGYQFMFDKMRGNLDGFDRISDVQILRRSRQRRRT